LLDALDIKDELMESNSDIAVVIYCNDMKNNCLQRLMQLGIESEVMEGGSVRQKIITF
jgi:hypothetical protein